MMQKMWRTVVALSFLLPLACCGVLYFKPSPVEVVQCGNSTSGQTCADGQTCCMQANGFYGCCALNQATCCEDKIHCCPQGYKCDNARGTCVQGSHLVRQMALASSVPKSKNKDDNIKPDTPFSIECPDHQTYCDDGCTCCLMPNQTWGCCPLPNAVCCSDGVHCCPQGYKCDLVHEACVSSTRPSLPMSIKQPAIKVQETRNTEASLQALSIPCPGNVYYCNDSSTCCQYDCPGGWGCCPDPDATCCADHKHCCPQDYTCDLTKMQCVKGHQGRPWQNYTPAKRRIPPVTSDANDVMLDVK